MKKILLFTALVGALNFLHGQEDVIDRMDGISVEQDTLIYLNDTIVYDNGTPFNDTVITKRFLGDSLTATSYLYNQAWETANQYSNLFRKAFGRFDLNREYNNTSGLFLDLTGTTLVRENQERQFQFYEGRYRITVIENAPFYVNVIQLGSGALRMEREGTGERYNFQPRNRRFFQVQIGSTWYKMHYHKNTPKSKRIYKSEALATGPNEITITQSN